MAWRLTTKSNFTIISVETMRSVPCESVSVYTPAPIPSQLQNPRTLHTHSTSQQIPSSERRKDKLKEVVVEIGIRFRAPSPSPRVSGHPDRLGSIADITRTRILNVGASAGGGVPFGAGTFHRLYWLSRRQVYSLCRTRRNVCITGIESVHSRMFCD